MHGGAGPGTVHLLRQGRDYHVQGLHVHLCRLPSSPKRAHETQPTNISSRRHWKTKRRCRTTRIAQASWQVGQNSHSAHDGPRHTRTFSATLERSHRLVCTQRPTPSASKTRSLTRQRRPFSSLTEGQSQDCHILTHLRGSSPCLAACSPEISPSGSRAAPSW
jgi:hypothetical protein